MDKHYATPFGKVFWRGRREEGFDAKSLECLRKVRLNALNRAVECLLDDEPIPNMFCVMKDDCLVQVAFLFSLEKEAPKRLAARLIHDYAKEIDADAAMALANLGVGGEFEGGHQDAIGVLTRRKITGGCSCYLLPYSNGKQGESPTPTFGEAMDCGENATFDMGILLPWFGQEIKN